MTYHIIATQSGPDFTALLQTPMLAVGFVVLVAVVLLFRELMR